MAGMRPREDSKPTSRAVRWRRRGVALLTLAVVAAAVAGVAPSGVAAAAQPAISNVAVSAPQPQVGELLTISTTIRNPETSSDGITVDRVALRPASGPFENYGSVSSPGTIPAGSDLTVPLTVSFGTPGVKDLRVVAFLESDSGQSFTLRYPVSVVVREGGPALSLSVEDDDAVVGATEPLNVTVANGDETALKELDLRLSGSSLSVDRPRRIAPSLDANTERSFAFDATFTEPGRQRAVATLTYVLSDGQTRTATESLTVDVERLREDVDVTADVETSGVDPPVVVEVTNFGNAPLEDLVLRAEADGRTVGRRTLEDLDADAARRVDLNVSNVSETELRVVAAYTTGSTAGTASTTIRYAPNPGRIQLTGVDVERDGDRLLISGSASNVGLSDADSVVVSVVPTAGVTPARPYQEYFVGTVPASDFVSFDLSARVTGDADTIPVRITYLTDGERDTDLVELDVSDVPADSSNDDASGTSTLLLVGGGLAVAFIVGVLAYLWWGRRTAGSEAEPDFE